ncbi:hypothetical protein ACSBR2_028322 [Camellia fascicularis]
MGQIVKRKKKGRPSKADLERRAAAEPESDVRRSRRRRNVRYTFDFDDYIDDDDEDDEDDEVEDEEDERGREKKLKLLLKLQSKDGDGESTPSRTQRVEHAPSASAFLSDYGDAANPLKKRKIEVHGDFGDEIDDDREEVRGRKKGSKGGDSVPGTPLDPPMGTPLPDKNSLELILDKLQKKDIYGVYAEPVDPEELPDYHDVIKHPMDFGTVRKKLGNGSYSTLEQFESDVFLICTNAMKYNAPDTIYHKQAHSIEELAKNKFQRLRIDTEHSEKELSSEQKTKSNSLPKKQIKKPMSRTAQEPVGSEFSSGATLATAGDFQCGSNATQSGGFKRLSNVDGSVEGNTSLIDNNLDKADDLLSGRGLLSRFGRKPPTNDENRRATYHISNQPVSRSESIFTTFDGEIKQLVAVGLHADHSYARSLARFAATLGPVAWKVASKRIEQALPPGFKFGRGWVGDYEPLPTPVLMLENCSPKEPIFLPKLHDTSGARKDEKTSKTTVSALEHAVTVPISEGKSSLSRAAITKRTSTPTASAQSIKGANLEGKQSFFGGSRPPPPTTTTATITASANYQQQSPRSRNVEPEKKVVKQVELNRPPSSANQNACDFVTEKQIPNGSSDAPVSPSTETVSRNRNLLQSSVPFKQPENNGFVLGRLPNGRDLSKSSGINGIPNHMVTSAAHFSRGQEQGLSDPVQLMRMLAENAQKQQKSLNHSSVDNPSIVPSVPYSGKDDPRNAAAAAARAWMSIGAGAGHKNQISTDSLYNPTRELQPQISQFQGDFAGSGMHFQRTKNNFPLQAFMTPPVQRGCEAQFQNRPVVVPQLVATDLSRFQMQSPWQVLNPQKQPRQKQESLPPDLNIDFQCSGSPVRQSSGVLVDSQQPDLALQL